METRRIILDTLAVTAFVVAGVLLFLATDAYDVFYHFTRTHEMWELDEYLLGLPLLVLGMVYFIARRLGEARREVELRRKAEEKARLAELETARLSRMKEEFMAVMSHELRTPLAGILGLLSVLESDGLTPDQEKLVQLALASGQSLNTLLSDVLEFSRLQQGKMAETAASFAPASLVLSVYNALTPSARAKGLRLDKPDVSGLPPVLVGMEGPIRHVLLNITGNAVKFTARGDVDIRVSYESLDERTGRLLLEVADTGPGIAPKDRNGYSSPSASWTAPWAGSRAASDSA